MFVLDFIGDAWGNDRGVMHETGDGVCASHSGTYGRRSASKTEKDRSAVRGRWLGVRAGVVRDARRQFLDRKSVV